MSKEWLDGGYEQPLEERPSYARARKVVFGSVIAATVLGCVALRSGYTQAQSIADSASVADAVADAETSAAEETARATVVRAVTPGLGMRVSNEYIESTGAPIGNQKGAAKLKWGELIVEPHRDTTLIALVDGAEATSGEESRWTWSVEGAENDYTGSRATHVFTRAGRHSVVLKLDGGDSRRLDGGDATQQQSQDGSQDENQDGSDTQVSTTEGKSTPIQSDDTGMTPLTVVTTVMAKWVRRELRSLTHDDRELFLDALHTMYHVETAEGRQSYGSKYVGIEYLVRKHLYGAASAECDHWHDDAGLMTHHMAFTLELEQSLQAINGRISVPYWEYSLDAYILGDNWQDSQIFNESWFGATSPGGKMKTVTEGRWAYTPVKSMARSYSNITNQWGLLRSPWNQNPVPYVTRHDKILGDGNYQPTFPSCDNFNSAFDQTSLADINPYLNGLTHGPVHLMIGGEWHHNNTGIARFFQNQESNFLLMAKVVWRHGFTRCDDTCVEGETDRDECTCTVPSEYLDLYDPYDVLTEKTGMLHWMSEYSVGKIYYDAKNDQRYHIKGYSPDEETAAWGQILSTLANPGWVGEMFTSAAPYDPTFWPIHTTAERFLWTRLLAASESPEKWAFDTTWGYNHDISTPSDYGEVCAWDKVTDKMGVPECVKSTCPGHNEHDTIPFTDFLGNGETYTNAEFFALMQPDNDDCPYVYDTFDYWWCSEQGYDWTA